MNTELTTYIVSNKEEMLKKRTFIIALLLFTTNSSVQYHHFSGIFLNMKCVKNSRMSISIKDLQALSKEKDAAYFMENIFFCLPNLRPTKISNLQLISTLVHKEKKK